MIDTNRLRALLADHPPQAYMSKDQEKIRDVWDAAREMLALLREIQTAGTWYGSALEIDTHAGHDGEAIERKLARLIGGSDG